MKKYKLIDYSFVACLNSSGKLNLEVHTMSLTATKVSLYIHVDPHAVNRLLATDF